MKEMQRQDIKSAIEHLKAIDKELIENSHLSVNYIIIMLEDLGNLVSKLQLENASLKKELYYDVQWK